MIYEITVAHRVQVEADSLSEAVKMIDRKEILIDGSDRHLMSVVEIGEDE